MMSPDPCRSNLQHRIVIRDGERRWFAGLRRLLDTQVTLTEVEHLPRLHSTLHGSVAWLTLIVTSHDTICDDLQWIATWRRNYRAGAVIVCVPAEESHWIFLVRAVGATWTFSDLQDLPRAARLVRCIARQMPEPPLSWREQIWNNLPWGDLHVRG